MARREGQATMDVLEAIEARHSYRGTYLPTPVPRKDLERIMRAGLAAPSGCNTQTTSVIAVDDPALLEKLHRVSHRHMGDTAPAMLCVLTQRIVSYRGRCFAVQDYAAAIENMLLAAVALGYASCWYEGYVTNEDKIGEKMAAILGVPDGYELICVLPIGTPAEPYRIVEKKPFGARAWFNGFGGANT